MQSRGGVEGGGSDHRPIVSGRRDPRPPRPTAPAPTAPHRARTSRTPRARADRNVRGGFTLARADLARAVLAALAEPGSVRHTVGLGY
ncbi:hypothetical protein GCM10017562_07350 [Streptomyces roseofulvus]